MDGKRARRRALGFYTPVGRRDGDGRRRRGRRPGAKRAEGREWGGRRGCRQARTQADGAERSGPRRDAPRSAPQSPPSSAAQAPQPETPEATTGHGRRPGYIGPRVRGERGIAPEGWPLRFGHEAAQPRSRETRRGGLPARVSGPVDGRNRAPSAATRSPRTHSVGAADQPTVRGQSFVTPFPLAPLSRMG